VPSLRTMLCGIFIGGASRRMGFPKARLRLSTGEALLERTVRVVCEAGLDPVLVGSHVPIEPCLRLPSIRSLPDAAPDSGPLGGLVSLLDAADGECVVVVACDMPYLDAAHLRRLTEAPRGAPVIAPRWDGRWEPLAARYDARRVLRTAIERLKMRSLGLQGFLDDVGAHELELAADDRAWLEDWDTPEDRTKAEEGRMTP